MSADSESDRATDTEEDNDASEPWAKGAGINPRSIVAAKRVVGYVMRTRDYRLKLGGHSGEDKDV